MRGSGWIGAALALLAGGSAAAEIYRWTDAKGQVHFTQDLSQVPAAQRAAALERALLPPATPERLNTYSTPERADAPASRASGPVQAPSEPAYRIPVQRAGSALLVAVRVNDTLSVPFLVDTGASDVSLPRWAAERLGIEESGRTREYMTANGVIVESVVMLRSLDLGGARVEGVSASISQSMEVGLLGLGFFNHFTTNVDAARGMLTLIPNDLVESGGILAGRSEAQWRSEFAGLRDRLSRVDQEEGRTNPNQSSKLRRLEGQREDLLRQLEILEAEADQARVPLQWRE